MRNRDAVLAAKRAKRQEWREANPEKAAQQLAAWKLAHPFKSAEYHRRKRAIKLGVKTEYYTAEDVVARWGTVCHICGKEIDMNAPRKVGTRGWKRGLHLDHVIPMSRGGEDTLANVKPTHGLCNLRKHANLVEE
jgi:5-methylcytosine-specific restriction endonuclease McrA